MEWFRFYNDVRSDNKLKTLSDSEFRVWVNLLCLTSAQSEDDRGTIPADDRFVLAAEVAHADEALLEATLAKLERLRIVAVEEEVIHFLKWDAKQPSRENPLWLVRRMGWNRLRRKLAPLVFKRDGYRCRNCGDTEDLQVDHVIPLARGGGNEPGNLQTLCKRCNNAKGPHGRRSSGAAQ